MKVATAEMTTIRPMTEKEVEAVVALQAAAFPPPFPQEYHWDAPHIRAHLRRFPEGQFVATQGGVVVGSCSNTIVSEAKWQAHGSWIATVGPPDLRDFTGEGTTLYGLDITVHPDARRQGLGRAFYEARYGLCRAKGLARYGTGCRMPDFRASGVPTVEQYAEEVVGGKRQDRTLTPLLRYGLTFLTVVRGYMEDFESDDAGALLERGPLSLRIASVAWKMRRNRSDAGYFGHWHDLVSEAHDEGAKVVVFPELHLLELLPLAKKIKPQDSAEYLVQYSEAMEEWIARISDSSDMIIVGGSHFRRVDDRIQNVCAVGIPGGGTVLQPKNNLTVYEREAWNIQPGRGLSRLPQGLGVNVCYDSEFPAAARALAEAGMKTLCVPSWTETQRGFQRVRWSCLARAVENGVFVVHSSLVGDLDREPVPWTFGSSMIASPSVDPFPIEAILRETPLGEEGVVYADLDYEMLEEARTNGEVRNWQDRNEGDWTVAPEDSI